MRKSKKAGGLPVGLPAPSSRKYRNRKTVYDGETYDSGMEAKRAMELDLLQRAGEIQGYQRQYSFPLEVNGKTVAVYKADFMVAEKNGPSVVEEVKGMWTDYARLKWRLFDACYPSVPKRIIGTDYKPRGKRCKK
jgi:hypothetical protein